MAKEENAEIQTLTGKDIGRIIQREKEERSNNTRKF